MNRKHGDIGIKLLETYGRPSTCCAAPEQEKEKCYASIPPQIHHSGHRPANWEQMIDDAAMNIHIRNQAVRLLKFYAQHKNGFRPALSLIEKATGIAANKVSEVRKRLVKKGLIAYTGDKIYIDWNHIRIYAGLNKPIRIPQKGNCYFAPAEEHLKNSGRRYPSKNTRQQKRQLSELSSIERFYLYLQSLNEEEFTVLINAFARLKEKDNPNNR